MRFNYKYSGSSSVTNTSSSTGVSFAPDVNREPTFFVGDLHHKIPFREAVSALHDVVVSDLRFKQKDKTDYKSWLKEQEEVWLAEAMEGKGNLEQRIKKVQTELSGIRSQRSEIMGPYLKAQRKYFNYLHKNDPDAWWVLDPVITVHPDQIFFECFSQDESAYGKLSCSHNVFTHVNEYKCGTTNIDYSKALYTEFQKIRTYKNTSFKIDPKGFDVKTGGDEYREEKIDLPDSWVRGFLQVSTAMTLKNVSFDLSPTDMANFLMILKRNKEKESPRSIRFKLEPGKRIEVVFEPWNFIITCNSIYKGQTSEEIRIWGRRRLLMLERLLPITKSIKVQLLGTGMPSFFVADLGEMSFTLGLSGWTANDWSSASQLDLMAPRDEVDSITLQKVFLTLKENWFLSGQNLARKLSLPLQTIERSLAIFTQAGKVVFDIENQVYRVRELAKDGIDIETLRFSGDTERNGVHLALKGVYSDYQEKSYADHIALSGKFKGHGNTFVKIDWDDHIIDGACGCSYFYKNGLKKGPCEHIIALRMIRKKKQNY
jgi:hypothetical protein